MVKSLRFLLLAFLGIIFCGNAMAEDIIWQEDFSSYKADDVPTGGDYQYACENGGGTTKIYAANIAGGTAPELLIGKKCRFFHCYYSFEWQEWNVHPLLYGQLWPYYGCSCK